MVNVNAIEGIKYGFRLIGYAILVVGVGFVIMIIGSVMAENSPVIGVSFVLVGFLLFYAGLLGMGYKVIADAVEKGVRAANTQTATVEASGQPGRVRGRHQGGQQADQTGRGDAQDSQQ